MCTYGPLQYSTSRLAADKAPQCGSMTVVLPRYREPNAATRPLLRLACGLLGAVACYFASGPVLFSIEGTSLFRRPQPAPRAAPLTVAEYTTLGPAQPDGVVRAVVEKSTGPTLARGWRLVRDRACPKRSTWSGGVIDGSRPTIPPEDGKPKDANSRCVLLSLSDAERSGQRVDAVQLCGELCARHQPDCRYTPSHCVHCVQLGYSIS